MKSDAREKSAQWKSHGRPDHDVGLFQFMVFQPIGRDFAGPADDIRCRFQFPFQRNIPVDGDGDDHVGPSVFENIDRNEAGYAPV